MQHFYLRKVKLKLDKFLNAIKSIISILFCSTRKGQEMWAVQLLSGVQLFVTPWTAAPQSSLSITNSWNLLKLMSIELVMPSNHLVLCHLIRLLPSIFPSIRAFSNESGGQCIGASAPASVLPMKYSGLVSFRMDCLDFLGSQGTFKSLLQHHSSKASILWHSAFLMVQLSHPYVTTGKTIALTRQTFIGKVMSLPFNMLSRLVRVFLPRRKHLLISCWSHHLQWFWSPRK